MLTGSIGLEPILQQAGLSHTVNTFTPFELDPWDVKTAASCLQALANNYKVLFREGAKGRMLKLIGSPIPHHVPIFFNYIYID